MRVRVESTVDVDSAKGTIFLLVIVMDLILILHQ